MYTADDLQRHADTYGYNVKAFEKAVRLLGIMNALSAHPYLRDQFALKGGSALNLFLLDAPRLSVDDEATTTTEGTVPTTTATTAVVTTVPTTDPTTTPTTEDTTVPTATTTPTTTVPATTTTTSSTTTTSTTEPTTVGV